MIEGFNTAPLSLSPRGDLAYSKGTAPKVSEPGVEAEHSDAGGEGVEAELDIAGSRVGRAPQEAAGRRTAMQRGRLALRPRAAGVPQRVYDSVEHYAVRLAPLCLHRLERLRRAIVTQVTHNSTPLVQKTVEERYPPAGEQRPTYTDATLKGNPRIPERQILHNY